MTRSGVPTAPRPCGSVRPSGWPPATAADLLVINDWVEDDWRPRKGQFLLQTWHGTPLKRIALGRGDRTPRLFAAVVKQSSRWSAMLAQSPSAVEGSPACVCRGRTDVGRGIPAQRRHRPRRRRGSPGRRSESPRPKVVLFAPTWRDDALDSPDLLDVVRPCRRGWGRNGPFSCAGHARTIGPAPRRSWDRVLDVTRVPDVSPLLATADVLITDYSSVMFDFSASGRPMVFFVADERGVRHDDPRLLLGPRCRVRPARSSVRRPTVRTPCCRQRAGPGALGDEVCRVAG